MSLSCWLTVVDAVYSGYYAQSYADWPVGTTTNGTTVLGIPAIWKLYITVGTGGFLLLLGYLLIRDWVYFDNDLGNGERGNESFVETTESLFK